MRTCYIVGAGEFYGSIKPQKGDMVIAADGGYDTLLGLGISPDILIGDMDSINDCICDIEAQVYPVRKDETDSFLAYREGVRMGYESFRLYGCVGGREDHTFANYALLIYAKDQGHSMTLIGKDMEAFAIKNERISLCGTPTSHLSVFAFGSEARGVSLRGLEYEADNITLTPAFPLGVSNRFTDAKAEIEVNDGTLLIMREL